MTREQELRQSLLENGLDFIREGIESLFGDYNPPPRAYKFGLLNIFSGTLLVLKERLRRADPDRIFLTQKDGSLSTKTVNFAQVIDRLQSDAGVRLSEDDQKLLERVQQQRNAIEHHETVLELREARKLVDSLAEFLECFLRQELKEALLEGLSGTAARELAELAKISEHLHRVQYEEWFARAKKFSRVGKKRLAELADYDPLNGDEPLECDACGSYAVVQIKDDIGVCTESGCRELHRLESCNRCGNLFIANRIGYCDNCMAEQRERFERDD
jgi:hypothetical protein